MNKNNEIPFEKAKPAILKIKDFRNLLLTRLFITMALQVQAVIVGWQVYKIRPEALLLGLIGLTEGVPAIIGSFWAGHVVDTSRPAKVFKMCILVLMLNTFFIFLSVCPWLSLGNHAKLIILFSGIFVSGAARSFSAPSVFSLIPKIVGRALIPAASAYTSSIFQFASIIGPAIGGLAYGFGGPVAAFLIPCGLSLISFVLVNFLSLEVCGMRSELVREPALQSIKSGIKFVLENNILLSVMSLDMFSVLFGGATSVLPIFADRVFGVGSMGLGFLRAAPAVGSVCIAAFFAVKPMKTISGGRLLFVVAGFGLSMICFSLSSNFYLALIFLCFSGIFDGVSMIIRGTIMQLLTPDHMRGRVSSMSTVFITSSNEIGAFESGLAAQYMGLIPSVLFGGIMTLVVVATVTWLTPALKNKTIET